MFKYGSNGVQRVGFLGSLRNYIRQGLLMGANHPKRSLTMPFNIEDYREVPGKGRYENPYEQRYRVLRNIHTDFEMEEYQVLFENETEYQHFYDAFEWRLSQPNIVNTTYFVENLKREFCSTIYAGTLYTERIPLKLSEIKDIPYPDNLYILMSALEGFSVIYNKIGFFVVQQYMICINNHGKSKVWINDDLSKNYPDFCDAEDDGSEQDMVRRAVDLLDQNTDPSTRPISVKEYFSHHHRNPRFLDAKRLIRQLAKQYKTQIPQSFDCIKDILNPQFDSQGYNQSQINDRISVNQSVRITKRLTYPMAQLTDEQRRSIRQSQDQNVRESRLTVESRSQARHNKNQIERRFLSFNSNVRQAASPVMYRPPQLMMAPGQQHQPIMTRNPIIQHMHQPVMRQVPRYQSPVLMQAGPGPMHIQRQSENFAYNNSSRIAYAPNRAFSIMRSSHVEPPHRVMAPAPTNIKMYRSDEEYHPHYNKNYTQVQAEPKHRNQEKLPKKKQYKSKKGYNEQSQFSESSIHSDRNSMQFGRKRVKKSVISTDNDRKHRPKKNKQSDKKNYSKNRQRSKIKNQRVYQDERNSHHYSSKPPSKGRKYQKHNNLSNLMEYIDQEENHSRHPEDYRIQIISEEQLNDKKITEPLFHNQLSNVSYRQVQKQRNRPAINVFGSDIPKRQFTEEAQKSKQQLQMAQKNMQKAIQKTRQVISNGETRNSPRQGYPQQNMGVQAKQYYSAKFDHDLDPEIAYDLLGMGLS